MTTAVSRLIQVTFILSTTVFLILAVVELRTSIRSVDVSIIAERIEAGQIVTRSLAEAVAKNAVGLAAEGYCRSDVVAAGLTLVLFDLDQQDPSRDYDAWLVSAAETRDYLLHAMGCMPANSNVWLRMAALQSVIAEEPEEVARLISQSATFAPAEQSSLLARFNFWNSFGLATLKAGSPALSEDITTLLRFGDRCIVNAALARVNTRLKPFVDDIWQALGATSTARFSKRCSM